MDLQVCYSPGQTPLLVLHEALGNRFNWRSQYEFFQSQDQEVLAYGLARHRQSCPHQRYSLERHRRDLTQLLQNFHIQVLILCCHSYGVPLGLEWARRNPVRTLITINSDTHDLDFWWDSLMKFIGWGGKHVYRFPKVQQLTDTLCSAHRYDVRQWFFAESPMPIERHLYKALEIFWGYNFFSRNPTDWQPDSPVLEVSGGQDPTFTAAWQRI